MTTPKATIKLCLLALVSFAIATTPLLAAQPAKPGAEKKEAGEKKAAVAGPFHGKLASVDKPGKTITVGKRTFHITSETKINKAGKPATLDEGVVGEEVSGYVKPDENGKLVATKVNFGPKTEAPTTKAPEKKKEK